MSYPTETIDVTAPIAEDDEYDYYEPEINIGNVKQYQSNHFTTARRYSKGAANDIKKQARAHHIAMCNGLGVEPAPHFTRRDTAAKLRGSKAYHKKRQIMCAVQSERHARISDIQNDIQQTRDMNYDLPITKTRRFAATDHPCNPLIPGSVFPKKINLPRKSFRDALVW
jgi:hypothetical protein